MTRQYFDCEPTTTHFDWTPGVIPKPPSLMPKDRQTDSQGCQTETADRLSDELDRQRDCMMDSGTMT